jgi:hypothetical protein
MDAKRFKSGVKLMVSPEIDVTFSSVIRFRYVELFGFINEKAYSQL